MRITGGEWRSRRLKGPGRNTRIRPTPDALRERVFAVLGDQIVGARLLDLYAGTGAVGFEALSRGATEVVFVERHRPAVELIRTNSRALGADDRIRIIHRAAARSVAQVATGGQIFDIAWSDPPFENWKDGLEVLVSAFRLAVISPSGAACFECPEHADVAGALPDEIEIVRDLAGGASRVVLLKRGWRLGARSPARPPTGTRNKEPETPPTTRIA